MSCNLEVLDRNAAQCLIPDLCMPFDFAVCMPVAMNYTSQELSSGVHILPYLCPYKLTIFLVFVKLLNFIYFNKSCYLSFFFFLFLTVFTF